MNEQEYKKPRRFRGFIFPRGDVIREKKSEEKQYRFGYQGQYAERDEETGWNHFELREYDPVIGRWTSTDPARQFESPFVAFGNHPVAAADPDGGTALSPIYGYDRKFLGVDSEGFSGKVVLMEEQLYSQLTNNGNEVLEHSFVMSIAEKGIFAELLADSWRIGTKEYSDILTHIVSRTEGIRNFEQINGGAIDIYYEYSAQRQLRLTGHSTRRMSTYPDKSVVMNWNQKRDMNTVEAIQNFLGVHEWMGHAVHGFTHQHNKTGDKAYGLQINHPTFNVLKNTNRNLYEEVLERYSTTPSEW